MTSLTERLNKIVEFDASHAIDIIDMVGMQAENMRLQPILKALIECVGALEFECGNKCHPEHNPCNARDVLTALEQAIEKQEME